MGSVNVNAVSADSNATVSGAGTVSLESGRNDITNYGSAKWKRQDLHHPYSRRAGGGLPQGSGGSSPRPQAAGRGRETASRREAAVPDLPAAPACHGGIFRKRTGRHVTIVEVVAAYNRSSESRNKRMIKKKNRTH